MSDCMTAGKGFLALVAPLFLIVSACGSGGGGSGAPGGGSGGEDGGADPPLAAFDADVRSGSAPLVVTFADGSSGTIDTWAWDFGDGQTSSAQNPSHTYTAAGTFDVTLTVTGPDGSDAHVEPDFITLNAGGGDPPVAEFVADVRSGQAPLTVNFTDGSSGSINTWAWSFGDGLVSSLQNPSHTYTTAGTFDVSLTVTGPDGASTHIEPDFISLTAGTDCNSEDATLNTKFPLKDGSYDFIPVTSDGRGFWCVYSVRDREDGSPGVGNNVGIFLVELDANNVLMFGAGYGEIKFGGQGPLRDAAFDMGLVDELIQGCMGRDPAQTTIQFWTPHGHPDHVHSAGIRELRLLNYAVSDIYYHDADEGAVVGSAGWTSQDTGIFRPISGPDCTTALWSSPGDLGWIWVMRRSGHTSGSVDIVIDVDGNTNDRVVILGSADGTLCDSILTGVRFKVTAHGNVLIP